MRTITLLKKLEGIHTIPSIMDALHVSKTMAIYYVYRLRREGYVKTKYSSQKNRVYTISLENKLGGVSYYDVLNEHSPIKIVAPENYVMYRQRPSVEETIIFALKKRSVRLILSAIALFKKVTNWKLLYALARKEKLQRSIGALYDTARSIFRVRSMTKRFRNNSLPSKKDKFEDIIPYMKSRDFQHIERKWKVHIPFNKIDFEDYA